jgi:hypothetical protein
MIDMIVTPSIGIGASKMNRAAGQVITVTYP